VTLLVVGLALFLLLLDNTNLRCRHLGSTLYFLLLWLLLVSLLVMSLPLVLVVVGLGIMWASFLMRIGWSGLLVMGIRLDQLMGLHAVGFFGLITLLAIRSGNILQQDHLLGGLGINNHIGTDGTGSGERFGRRLLDFQRCCMAKSHQG